MRVLHVHSGNLSGGVETFLTTLARCRHLAPAMEMSAALCFDGDAAARLRNEGMLTHILGEVRLRRPESVWRARQRLAKILRTVTYDVVVCHQSWPHAIFGSVAKTSGLPEVFWVHMAQDTKHWLDWLAWRAQSDLVIVNSRFTASTLPKTIGRIEVIYPPVTMNSEDVLPGRTTDEVRRELSTRSDDVVIIQVSRMESLKGQRSCLAALAKLRGRGGWTCWQVGGPQIPAELRYFDTLQEDAHRLGIADRVRFAGQRSDVRALLNAADIFCQPNLRPEGFGIGFIEAMSAGLPVITSAIGAASEVVDPSCGVLVRPDDVDALASALASLVDDRRERDRLGRGGRERACMLCDAEEQMNRIAAALESTLHHKVDTNGRDRSRGSRAAL